MGDVTCNSIEYIEGLPCCVNYYQDNNSCLPCLTGSFGFNCTQRCKPGKYGEACLKECVDCAPEDCHYNSGCPKNENAITTIFDEKNNSAQPQFTQPGFSQPEITPSIEPVTCADCSITNNGMISKIIINGSLIIALLLVLIIIISIRKYLMFRYWKRKAKLNPAPLLVTNSVYSDVEEMPGNDSHTKRTKRKNKRDSGGKHQTCRDES